MSEFLHEALPVAVRICFVYLVITYLLFAAQLVAAAMENARRFREERVEDYALLAHSRFTIPVSVILPAYNEASVVLFSVRTALAFDYFEHEVIVVNDGSTDDTMAVLTAEFDLYPHQVFFRSTLPAEAVRGTYRSATEPRLIVVDKVNGGKADALNAGVNVSRYRYVCCLDGDTIYERDALLKGMRLAVSDPAQVVGVTSLFAVGGHPERQAGEHADEPRRMDRSLIINFQHIDYLRSFMNNRAAWSHLDYMLCCSGGFMIWRRDLVVEVGGFSPDFTCEDIEMTFRLQEKLRREGRPCRILSLPDTVAITEGPARILSLVSQRARWQRVIMETVWHYRRMFLNPRYGAVGVIGMPFYVITEVIAPLLELLAAITLGLAVYFRLFDFVAFLLFLAALSLLNACFTVAALLMQDRLMREVRWRDLLHLVLISPLEMIAYRPWMTYARVKGTVDFFRGEKGWDKFERNRREPEAA